MKNNTKIISGIGILIILLLAILVYSSMGGNTEDAAKNLGKGINPPRGNSSSENIIIEFGDFKCPACKASHPIINEILENYNVALYYRNFPLAMHGQISFLASEAAECANEQGKFWEYHDILYDNQESLMMKRDLIVYAQQIKLNEEEFSLCLDSEKYKANIEEDIKDARNAGIKGTPTFYVNGRQVTGADKSLIIRYLEEN